MNTDRERLAADFLRQTSKPLVGRTEPTVSWFGTPAERDLIVHALRGPAQEWQDISTAPKEGELIDVWANGSRSTDVYWGRRDSDYVKPRFGWCVLGDDGCAHPIEPTLWRPLPAPPVAVIAEERTD